MQCCKLPHSLKQLRLLPAHPGNLPQSGQLTEASTHPGDVIQLTLHERARSHFRGYSEFPSALLTQEIFLRDRSLIAASEQICYFTSVVLQHSLKIQNNFLSGFH